MTLQDALRVIDVALKPKYLNNVQELVFTQSWEGKTYQEIAVDAGYDEDYIRGIGFQLWKLLSEAFSERVTKSNFRVVLRRHEDLPQEIADATPRQPETLAERSIGLSASPFQAVPELPEGPVSLESAFYVERPPIEPRCYAEILKPGALIRLRAPHQMGKTSLKNRILAYAEQQGYHTVRLNFEQTDEAILGDLNRFLRWLCATVSQQLQIQPQLDDYWEADFGSKSSCTLYFQAYLLEHLDRPMVLALDEVNRLFEYPTIAQNFFPLLRSWYEDAKEQAIWQKLRLIVVHSTETYVPLDINQSPFNVGLAIRLPPFDTEQVKDLAQRHGLDWRHTPSAEQLIDMVGGHPYRIRQALYNLSRQDLTLEQLLQTAPTSTGIYSDCLRHHWTMLQQHPHLKQALMAVLQSKTPIALDPVLAYQLESMDLITLVDGQASISCKLYSLYFGSQLDF